MPGSDSWAAQGWLRHPPPPSRVPSLSPEQVQIAAGPRCGCTDCTEAIGFPLTLPGRHCPSLTPPRAEQGRREDLPGPTSRSRGTIATRVDPRARHLLQGDSQFFGGGEHSCSLGTCRTGEQAVPVMRVIVQESPERATALMAFGNCPAACHPCGSRRRLRHRFLNWMSRHPIVLPG